MPVLICTFLDLAFDHLERGRALGIDADCGHRQRQGLFRLGHDVCIANMPQPHLAGIIDCDAHAPKARFGAHRRLDQTHGSGEALVDAGNLQRHFLAGRKAKHVLLGNVGAQFQKAFAHQHVHRLAEALAMLPTVALRSTTSPATGAFMSVRACFRSMSAICASTTSTCAFADLPACVADLTRASATSAFEPAWSAVAFAEIALLRKALGAFLHAHRLVERRARLGLLRIRLRDRRNGAGARGLKLAALKISADVETLARMSPLRHNTDIDRERLDCLPLDLRLDGDLLDRLDHARGKQHRSVSSAFDAAITEIAGSVAQAGPLASGLPPLPRCKHRGQCKGAESVPEIHETTCLLGRFRIGLDARKLSTMFFDGFDHQCGKLPSSREADRPRCAPSWPKGPGSAS